jgi:hypothetical protein
MWKCNIEKVDNGFIVTTFEETEENKITEVKNVFQHDDENIDREIQSEDVEIVDVLRFVAEHFGVINSKHNRYNLEIGFKKNKMGE